MSESSSKTNRLITRLIKENVGFEGAQAMFRILTNKNVFFKIFWAVCLLVSNLICGFLLVQTLLTYLSYEVYTKATTVHETPAVFPKITICNSALATTAYALNLIKEVGEEVSPGISIFDQNQLSNLSWSDQQQLLLNTFDAFNNKIKSLPDESKKKLVHSFDDILITCYFGFQPCTSADFVWRYDPVYGNCYSFNSNSSDLKETVIPGAGYGLQLAVYVGYHENLNVFNFGWLSNVYFTHIYGLNLIIENNTYLSSNKWNWIGLDGGTINYMPIQRKFSFKMPKPYSECDIDNDSPGHFDSVYYNRILNSPYQYSQEFCLIQCLQDKVLKLCNCTYPFYLALVDQVCQNDANLNCTMKFFIYNTSLLAAHSKNCLTKCPLECNYTEFTFSMTSQRSSGYGYVRSILENTNLSSDFNTTPINPETASNKFVQLFAYYDSLTYSVSTDTPSMEIVSFLANIGGTLGLFLGLSLLSVCEIIHVFFETCLN